MSHLEPPPALAALGFLVGRFQGEGRFEQAGTTFEKEVVGRWEAGGHFLALSMTASYRVRDAIADVHKPREKGSSDELKGAMERLEKASHKAAEELYKTAGAAPGAPGPQEGQPAEETKKDNVVDAEFKQV